MQHRYLAVLLASICLGACGGSREFPNATDYPLEAWIDDERWVGWLQLRVSDTGVDPHVDLRPVQANGSISPAQFIQAGVYHSQQALVDETGVTIAGAGEIGAGTWTRSVSGLEERSPVELTEVSIRLNMTSHAVDGRLDLQDGTTSYTAWLTGAPTFVCPSGTRHTWRSSQDPTLVFEFECDGE